MDNWDDLIKAQYEADRRRQQQLIRKAREKAIVQQRQANELLAAQELVKQLQIEALVTAFYEAVVQPYHPKTSLRTSDTRFEIVLKEPYEDSLTAASGELAGITKSWIVPGISIIVETTSNGVFVNGANVLPLTRSRLKEVFQEKAKLALQQFDPYTYGSPPPPPPPPPEEQSPPSLVTRFLRWLSS